MSSLTNYGENILADWMFRGQVYSPPGTWYVGLLSAAPSDSAAGTELSNPSYTRVGVVSDLANWSGTQSAGSTAVSSGTGGTISNNSVINFPTPGEDWGQVTHFGLYDAPTGGHLWFYAPLQNIKSIFTNDVVTIPPGDITIQVDN